MYKLLLCGNNKVKDDLLILILSIIKTIDEPVEIHFLTGDFSFLNPDYIPLKEENISYYKKILKEKNNESDFKVHDISSLVIEDLRKSKNKKTVYSPYSFIRLYITQLLEFTRKILYLDTDVIICKDIKDLYETDISKYEFAACLDYYGRHWINKRYCNSGVMLINLDLCRERKLFERCLEKIKTKRMFMPDQSSLNKLVKDKLILDDKYNNQSPKQKEIGDIVIRHFSKKIFYFPYFRTANIKPHMVDKVHKVLKFYEHDDILNEYLERKKDLIE